MPIEPAAIAAAAGLKVRCAPTGPSSFGRKAAGSLPARLEAEEVAQLACQDDDGDAGGEADDDRMRDVFDVGAEPQEGRRRSG